MRTVIGNDLIELPYGYNRIRSGRIRKGDIAWHPTVIGNIGWVEINDAYLGSDVADEIFYAVARKKRRNMKRNGFTGQPFPRE